MNILTAQNLAKSFGLRQLFKDLSFGIDERDRMGLIGVNGCGKSTMLRIIAGLEPTDAGLVTMRTGLRVEYLSQNPPFDPDHTVIEHAFATQGGPHGNLGVLVRDYELCCLHVEEHPNDEAEFERLNDLMARMSEANAWEYETQAKTILSKLGIRNYDSKMPTLSGGQRRRVALARALLAEPDLLILDEPTNHLDADTIAWLEGYLRNFNGAVVLVTHDRYFLDRVTNVIYEIDRGDVRRFDGGYAFYLEHKAEIEADFAKHEDRRRNLLRREMEWLQRGPKARTTKSKARIDSAHKLMEQNFERTRETLNFFSGSRRLGKKVIEAEGLTKSYGENLVIDNFDYVFAPGDRIGLIGPNGCGKSTLVGLLTGKLAPDAGRLEIGDTVVLSVYEQEAAELEPNERAIEYIKRTGGEVLRAADGSNISASAMLERFQFDGQMQYTPVGKLSGGERRRLYLVRTLMSDPNFLVLDEPTNDLDINTLQALEDYLENFAGCLLVISHDRYFLDRTIDRVLAWGPDKGWRLWPGAYSDYERMKAEEESEQRGDKDRGQKDRGEKRKLEPLQTTATTPPARVKLNSKEKREFETLEKDIANLEATLEDLNAKMAKAANDYTKLMDLTAEQTKLQDKLDKATTRWAELADRAG